jgi:Cu-Zn family superoxide dismutase
MGVLSQAGDAVSKIIKFARQSSDSVDLESLGISFNRDLLGALSLDSRQGGGALGGVGQFSLFAVFLTVLATTLVVSPQLRDHIIGDTKATCTFTGDVEGSVEILQKTGQTSSIFKLNLSGLTAGKHGFHVHEKGDLSDSCRGAGGHFNPLQENHSSPTSTKRHVGDLGNVVADASGNVVAEIMDSQAVLVGTNSIAGRALVIHAGEDDLGYGGDSGSLSTGNAGSRAGCCIIKMAASIISV